MDEDDEPTQTHPSDAPLPLSGGGALFAPPPYSQIRLDGSDAAAGLEAIRGSLTTVASWLNAMPAGTLGSTSGASEALKGIYTGIWDMFRSQAADFPIVSPTAPASSMTLCCGVVLVKTLV